MADINFLSPASGATAGTGAAPAGDPAALDYELIELLFFAYRDFVAEPDEALADLGFGRAHHRVVYFVTRNPGIRVADLLDILRITKQSLARVLKELVDGGYIRQETGQSDRRERLLYASDRGAALARDLSSRQHRRIAGALSTLPEGARQTVRDFLDRMGDVPHAHGTTERR